MARDSDLTGEVYIVVGPKPVELDGGQLVESLTNREVRRAAGHAWEYSQGDDLRKLRAEAKRRGMVVA